MMILGWQEESKETFLKEEGQSSLCLHNTIDLLKQAMMSL